jgi:hypothetical protein
MDYSVDGDLVREAIQKILLISAQARNIARWYEENPTAIYLPKEVEHFREYRRLTISEVASIVGFATPKSAIVWCKAHKIVSSPGQGSSRQGQIQ